MRTAAVPAWPDRETGARPSCYQVTQDTPTLPHNHIMQPGRRDPSGRSLCREREGYMRDGRTPSQSGRSFIIPATLPGPLASGKKSSLHQKKVNLSGTGIWPRLPLISYSDSSVRDESARLINNWLPRQERKGERCKECENVNSIPRSRFISLLFASYRRIYSKLSRTFVLIDRAGMRDRIWKSLEERWLALSRSSLGKLGDIDGRNQFAQQHNPCLVVDGDGEWSLARPDQFLLSF